MNFKAQTRKKTQGSVGSHKAFRCHGIKVAVNQAESPPNDQISPSVGNGKQYKQTYISSKITSVLKSITLG